MEIKQQLTWVWQKWGFSTSLNICSFYELLYKIRTLILSKPHLRQAQKRYLPFLGDSANLKHYSFEPTKKNQNEHKKNLNEYFYDSISITIRK